MPSAGAWEPIEWTFVCSESTKKDQQSREILCVFCHDDFPNFELCCCERCVKVLSEGATEHFFDEDPEAAAAPEGDTEMVAGNVMPTDVCMSTPLCSLLADNSTGVNSDEPMGTLRTSTGNI